MGLPWLKNKQASQTGISVEYRKPDESKDESPSESDDSGMEACAEDLMKGIDMRDKKQVVSAIKAMFEIMDSMPHEEGPHINDESESE